MCARETLAGLAQCGHWRWRMYFSLALVAALATAPLPVCQAPCGHHCWQVQQRGLLRRTARLTELLTTRFQRLQRSKKSHQHFIAANMPKPPGFFTVLQLLLYVGM